MIHFMISKCHLKRFVFFLHTKQLIKPIETDIPCRFFDPLAVLVERARPLLVKHPERKDAVDLLHEASLEDLNFQYIAYRIV